GEEPIPVAGLPALACRLLDNGLPEAGVGGPVLGFLSRSTRCQYHPTSAAPWISTNAVTCPPPCALSRAYQVPHASAGLGSSGGVRKAGGAVRSSAPSGAISAASRLVSAGRFHFSSTSFSSEVWSNTSERTQSGRA